MSSLLNDKQHNVACFSPPRTIYMRSHKNTNLCFYPEATNISDQRLLSVSHSNVIKQNIKHPVDVLLYEESLFLSKLISDTTHPSKV